MFNNTYIIVLLCILTNFSTLLAQHHYSGTVVDRYTSEPLSGAYILQDNKGIATTNDFGKFDFETSSEDGDFSISYIGYDIKHISPAELNGVISLEQSKIEINQIVVTASRNTKARKETPISIASISTKTLSEAQPTRLDEVLNKVSGVNMVDLGNEQHMMSIRQPISTKGVFLYLEDGLPIRPAGIFNHNALLEMNMAALQRIEVVRGPSSSTYGSEAIGGAINFVTKKPTARPSARIGIQANNIGYQRLDLSASDTYGKVGLGVSGYFARRKDGYREHSDFSKTALTFRADYLANEKNTLSLSTTYIDYYADMTGSLDSTYFYAKNYSSQHTFTNRKVYSLRTKLAFNHYWNDNNKTSLILYARDNSIRQNPSYRVKDDYSKWGNPDGDPSLAHGEINDNSTKSVGAVMQHVQNFKLLHGAALSVGASLDVSPNSFVANYISISKNDANVYTDFTKTDSLLSDYKVDLMNIGTYANFDLKVTDALQFTAAVRYDDIRFDYKNNLNAHAFSGAPDDIDDFTAFTPKVGLTYDFGKGNGMYANYSQGFLPPQISELYRGVKIPSLKPANYVNYEIGGWAQLNDKIAFDCSLYQLDGTNEIVSVQLDDGSRERRNAGKTAHKGIEYGVKWQVNSELNLRYSGSHSFHKYKDYVENGVDYSGLEMNGAPTWVANAEASYKPSFVPHLRLALEWMHVDDYFMDNANTASYPGYDIFNFRVGYKFKGIEVWSNIMNATNELYATRASRSRWGDSYSVGEPRAITLGLAYHLKSL